MPRLTKSNRKQVRGSFFREPPGIAKWKHKLDIFPRIKTISAQEGEEAAQAIEGEIHTWFEGRPNVPWDIFLSADGVWVCLDDDDIAFEFRMRWT